MALQKGSLSLGGLEQVMDVSIVVRGRKEPALSARTCFNHAASPPAKPRAACTWRQAACHCHQRQQIGRSDEAQAAGADVVGMDDLAEVVKSGELNFDVAIATPDSMRVVGQLGQVLGPRGLMPNPRLGTVTMDVAEAVKNAKAGQVRYRTDKNGIVHGGVGKVGFEPLAIKENIEALLADLKKAKPTSAKGTYVKKVVLSTTMGGGIPIDQASLEM